MNDQNTPTSIQSDYPITYKAIVKSPVSSRKEQDELKEKGNRVLMDRLMEYIRRGPFFFYDLVQHFEKEGYRDLLIAWGAIRSKEKFDRDEEGRYLWIRE